MTSPESLALREDMTISREAFLRSLPGAVGNVVFGVSGPDILFGDRASGWRISLVALPDLELGNIRLPRHHVEIFLTGYDEDATRRFVDRFALYFRRGGG